MLDNKVDVNLIVAENLMDKYTLNSIHLSKNSSKTRYSISIFRQRSRLPFVCTYQLLLSYASVEQERKYDSKYILGSDSDALRWAKELFEYYHEDATAVTEL
jgi:predicted transcriptional regulator